MKPNTTNLLLAAVLLVVLALGYMWYARASLVWQYSALLDRISPRELVEVDEEEFSRWLETLESDEWESLRTTDDGYGSVLPNFVPHGVEPTIEGWLEIRTRSFPSAESLSRSELKEMLKAARLRVEFDFIDTYSDNAILVCRREGVVLGFCQTFSRGVREYFILENGAYALYIAEPKR